MPITEIRSARDVKMQNCSLKEHPDLMEEVEQKVREKYAQKEGVDQVENEEKASDKTS